MKLSGYFALMLVLVPASSLAAPVELPLAPPATSIGYTVYALGLFPIAATYQRFSGTVRLDPAAPSFCQVSMTVQVASLAMADPARVRQALAPDMLDAVAYPTLSFTGTCQGSRAVGQLTLHGVTHDFAMQTRRDGASLVATGTLDRHLYGVDGLPHLVGRQIRIRMITTLPPGLAGAPG